MTKLPLAVLTMCFNEATMLPIWERYYVGQVGARNCYVIDHGSDDGSAERLNPQITVTRIPRVHHDDAERVEIVRSMLQRLLTYYERVLYTDCDEIIVADPRYFGCLTDFCQRRHADVVTMFGFVLVHDIDKEPDVDLTRPVLQQRRLIQFNSFLCKPTLVHRDVIWGIGFHHHDGPSNFDDIYLFHLAFFDKKLFLERQEKRNRSVPIHGPDTSHHSYKPAFALAHMRAHWVDRPHLGITEIQSGGPDRERYLSEILDEGRRDLIRVEKFGTMDGLYELPERFKNIF